MKIAVFGWYGHENAGDESIKFCLEHYLMSLGGIKTVDFYDLHENAIKGKTNQFDHYDLIVIGGGGLILSQHNYHNFILGLNTKVVTIGISVETELKGNPKKFSLALLQKSTVVLVRDLSSYQKLKYLDVDNKVKLSYDLTFLSSYEKVRQEKEGTLGINLFSKTNYSPLALRSLLFASRFFPTFTPKTIDFSKLINGITKTNAVVPIPLYCVQQEGINIPAYQMNDVRYLRKYFKGVPNSFDHLDIDKCQIFLSMRLHGLIFGIQKGIPILTFSSYPKQINLMREVGIERCLVPLNDLEKTHTAMEYIYKNESLIREKITSYKEKATNNIKNDLFRIF